METRLSLYKKAIGEKDFPFMAFYTTNEGEAELRWLTPEHTKTAPFLFTEAYCAPTYTPKEHCVLEINGAPTLVTPANTTKLEAIFEFYYINSEDA